LSRAALLWLGVAVLAVAPAGRFDPRCDLTSDARNTLADMTLRVLRELPGDVEAVAFARRDDPAAAELGALLARYGHASPQFRFRFTDADREPLLADSLGVATDGTVVLGTGGRTEIVRRPDEPSLTNALMRLSRTEGRRVRFLVGHRERSILDRSPDGLSRLATELRSTGIATEELTLLTAGASADPAAVVLVAGPRTDLFPEEVEWLEGHLAGGGRLLVLADPAPVPRLASFLRSLGADLGEDVVVDPQTRLYGADATVPVVTRYARHPITDPLAGRRLVPTFFPVARSVAARDGTLASGVLASTGDHAWAERDRGSLDGGGVATPDEGDLRGPVPIAVTAVRPGTSAPVLVVVGDSDFAANGNLDLSGNRDLAVNAIEWLFHDEDWIALRAPRAGVRPLVLSAEDFRRTVWLPAFGLPLLTAAAGVLAHRRVHGGHVSR